MKPLQIRPIKKMDNAAVAKVIRNVLEEFDVPKVGTAYADPSLDDLSSYYNQARAKYWVVTDRDRIVGGGGIAPLDNFDGSVCELQKMYFLAEARGRGLGRSMIDLCLVAAQEFGYKACYLETMSHMETAQGLYRSSGFEYLEAPMGDTGHFSCGVHMLKKIGR